MGRSWTTPVLLLLLLLNLHPGAGAAPSTVDLRLWLDVAEVFVGYETKDQNVGINGTLEVDDEMGLELSMDLTCTVELPFAAHVDPSELTVRFSTTITLACDILVPACTNNRTVKLFINVIAYYRGQPMASNQTPPLTIRVAEGPLGPDDPPDDPSSFIRGLGGGNFLPAIIIVAVLLALGGGWALARRRRKRKLSSR